MAHRKTTREESIDHRELLGRAIDEEGKSADGVKKVGSE